MAWRCVTLLRRRSTVVADAITVVVGYVAKCTDPAAYSPIVSDDGENDTSFLTLGTARRDD